MELGQEVNDQKRHIKALRFLGSYQKHLYRGEERGLAKLGLATGRIYNLKDQKSENNIIVRKAY